MKRLLFALPILILILVGCEYQITKEDISQVEELVEQIKAEKDNAPEQVVTPESSAPPDAATPPATNTLVTDSTYYHHTSQGKQEKGNMFSGKSTLVQCPGDSAYESCSSLVKHNQLDTGRVVWYGKVQPGNETICKKAGNQYRIVFGSGVTYGVCQKKEVTNTLVEPTTVSQGVKIKGDYQGRLKDHKRPYWYWPKPMAQYPKVFEISVPGCKTFKVQNNGKRVEIDGYHGYIVKQSDVAGRNKMSLIGPVSCKGTVAYVNQ